MPWLRVWLVACAIFVTRTAAARDGDINGPWPVLFGTDCSLSKSCSQVHLEAWDRPTCLVRIQARQRQDPLFAEKYESNNTFFFRRLANGTLDNNTGNPTDLTVHGCHVFCGEGTWYWDAVPRLTIWIIPIVLLLSNIELSPIDKHRFMTVLHALGDPIDSFWSLLHKIYVWHRLYAIAYDRCVPHEGHSWWSYSEMRWKARRERWRRWWKRTFTHWKRSLQWQARAFRKWIGGKVERLRMLVGIRTESRRAIHTDKQPERPGEDGEVDVNAETKKWDDLDDEEEFNEPNDRARVIATVLAGFEEVSGAYIESELWYTMVLDQLGNLGQLDGDNAQSSPAWEEWRHCARMLADSRTNEFMRTLLAICIYVLSVVAALDDKIGGGNTSKPGGRIGSAVFLMWLVPLALLSNVVGTFTSRRSCLTTMRQFVQRTKAIVDAEAEQRRKHLRLARPRESRRDDEVKAPAGTSESESHKPVPDTGQHDEQQQQREPPPPGNLVPASPTARGKESDASALRLPSPMLKGGPSLMSSANTSPASHGKARIEEDFESGNLVLPPPMRSKTGASSESGERPRSISVTFPNGAIESQPKRHQQRQSIGSYLGVGPKDSIYGSAQNVSRGSSVGSTLIAATGAGSGTTHEPQLKSLVQDLRHFTFPEREGGNSTDAASAIRSFGDTEAGGSSQKQQVRAGVGPGYGPAAQRDTVKPLIPIKTWVSYFNSMHWLGAIYTYRPWKIGYRSIRHKSGAHYASNWFLYCLAVFPVIISFMGAFIIMWYAVPIGWSCRHTWVVGFTVIWLLSNTFTIWLHNDKIPREEAHDSAAVSTKNGTGVSTPAARLVPASPGRRANHLDESPGPVATTTTSPTINAERDQGDAVYAGLPDNADRRDGGGGDNPSIKTSSPPHIIPTSNSEDGASADTRGTFLGPVWSYILGPRPGRWSERRRWYTMLVKDAIVGLGGLAVVFLSTSGIFNNCYCWSAYMWHRWLPGNWGREAYITLDTEEEYGLRADTVYGRVVWSCMGAQLVFFSGVVLLWWDGISVVRWNETRRRREWRHEVVIPEFVNPESAPAFESVREASANDEIKYDAASYLLFWCYKHEFAAQREENKRRRSTYAQEQTQRRFSISPQIMGKSTSSPKPEKVRRLSFIIGNPPVRTRTMEAERGEGEGWNDASSTS